MLARAEKQIKIVLELTEKEALWLQGYMQNALLLDEDSQTREKREQFFNVLKNELDLNPEKRIRNDLDLDIRDI
jgi:hypothetical protein